MQGVRLNAVLEFIAPKGVDSGGAIMFDMKAAVTVPKIFLSVPDTVPMRKLFLTEPKRSC